MERKIKKQRTFTVLWKILSKKQKSKEKAKHHQVEYLITNEVNLFTHDALVQIVRVT